MNRRGTPKFDRKGAAGFERFYREHFEAVSRYVARRLPVESHDEVVATTFVAAWRKFEKVDYPSLSWLYRIASYEVAHERRRMARHPELGRFNDLDLTDTRPLDEVIDLTTAFSQLSESDAELLRLLLWEQMSRAEAAEVLGCSVNALNVRYHRAINRLSSTLHRLAIASDETTPTTEETT